MLTKDIKIIKKSAKLLWKIYKGNINIYIDLFFYEKEVDLEDKYSQILKDAGILRKGNRGWIANVMVFPFRNKLIATDFLASIYKQEEGKFKRGIDDVWVMFPHETLLFINNLDKKRGKIALDIASGSGAISLFLTENFDKVISSDINPKAVSYARFNAVLNNLESKIVNVESDLFKELDNEKFDYICWNGPTVALPEVDKPEEVYPLYTYGGFDGASFTKKFISEVFNHVKKDYRIKWWDGSLGTSRQSSIEQYIRENLSDLPIKVTIEFLNQRRGVPLREYDEAYARYCLDKFDLNQNDKERMQAVEAWYEKLKKNQFSKVYISLISIEPSSKFNIFYKDASKTYVGPRQVYGFEWHKVSCAFIRRYLEQNNLS